MRGVCCTHPAESTELRCDAQGGLCPEAESMIRARVLPPQEPGCGVRLLVPNSLAGIQREAVPTVSQGRGRRETPSQSTDLSCKCHVPSPPSTVNPGQLHQIWSLNPFTRVPRRALPGRGSRSFYPPLQGPDGSRLGTGGFGWRKYGVGTGVSAGRAGAFQGIVGGVELRAWGARLWWASVVNPVSQIRGV